MSGSAELRAAGWPHSAVRQQHLKPCLLSCLAGRIAWEALFPPLPRFPRSAGMSLQPVSWFSAVTTSPELSPPALCHLEVVGTPGLVEAIPTAHLETFNPSGNPPQGVSGASLSWEGFPGRGQESHWPVHISCVVGAVLSPVLSVPEEPGRTRWCLATPGPCCNFSHGDTTLQSLLVPARPQPLLALNKDLVSRESPQNPVFSIL